MWCDAFPRVLPVLLQILFAPEAMNLVCNNKKLPIDVEHQLHPESWCVSVVSHARVADLTKPGVKKL